MGTRYIVSVVRVEDIGGSENRYDTRDTTLFEATHTDPMRLARFAPAEVLEALGAGDATAYDSAAVQHMASAVGADPSAENQAALGAMMPSAVAVTSEAPKRKRRTRQELADDDAAMALGYRDRFDRAEKEAAGTAVTVDAPSDAAALFGAPVDATDAAIVPTVHPADIPAEGWNPFEVR